MSLKEFFSLRTVAFLITMIIGLWSCIQWQQTSYYAGEHFPVGSDSYYHASRVLDMLETGKLPQFDKAIHAPEGSMVTWPWGYDTLLANYTIAVSFLTAGAYPITSIIAYFPLLLFFISILIVHKILSKLSVSILNHSLGLLFYAISHLTQGLYGVGRIDHHGAEQIVFLLVALCGLHWISKPGNKAIAISFGIILGGMPVIHTSLIVIMLPVSIYITLAWMRGEEPHNTIVVGYSAIITSLLLASQSLPVHEFHFEFSTYSWFHIYTVLVFLFLCLYLQHTPYNKKNASLLFLLLSACATPVFLQINALHYLQGDLYSFHFLTETRSPILGAKYLNIPSLVSWYSGLIYLMPLVFIWCVWAIFKDKSSAIRYLAIIGLFGLALSLNQFRFFVFGTLALIIISVYLLDRYLVIPGKYKWLYAIFMIVSTQAWSFPHLTTPPKTANNPTFIVILPGLRQLGHECQHNGGVVLTDSFDGHYIRYFSKCRVISNNFLITQQHEEKIRLTHEMFKLDSTELLHRYPWVDYIFVRLYRSELESFPNISKLKYDILFNDGPFKILHDSTHTIHIRDTSFPAYRIVKLQH